MKIGVYLDSSNLYYCCKGQYNKKINYQQLVDFIAPMGRICKLKAFSAQFGNQASGFIHSLKLLGFDMHYKEPKSFKTRYGLKHKADWDVGITIEIIRDMTELDAIILCTADSDFAPLVEYLQSQGKRVIVMACNISHELSEQADEYIEIPEVFML